MSRLIEDIAERFDLPADALAGAPRITLTGRSHAVIENHEGLLAYGGELIEVKARHMRIRITGSELLLRAMNVSTLVITGKIAAVETE